MPELAFHDTLPPLDDNPFDADSDFTTVFTSRDEDHTNEVFVRASTVARLMGWDAKSRTYRTMRKQCDNTHAQYNRGTGEPPRYALFLEVAAVQAFLIQYERYGKTRRSESVRKFITETVMNTPDLRSTISGDWTR